METPSLPKLAFPAFLSLFLLPAGPARAGADLTLGACSAAYRRAKTGPTQVPEACAAVLEAARKPVLEGAFDTEKKTFEDLMRACVPERAPFDAECADFYDYAAKLQKDLALRRTCAAAAPPASSGHELEDQRSQCDLVADQKTPPTLDACLQRGSLKNAGVTTPQCTKLILAADRKLTAALEDCPKPATPPEPGAIPNWALGAAPALGIKPETLMMRCLARRSVTYTPESVAADVKAAVADKDQREALGVAKARLAEQMRCRAQQLGAAPQAGGAPCQSVPALAPPPALPPPALPAAQPFPLPRPRPEQEISANECKKNVGNGMKWDAKAGKCAVIPRGQCTAANVHWHEDRCVALTKADCKPGQVLSRTRGCVNPQPTPPSPSVAAARRARAAAASAPDNPFFAIAAFFTKLFSPPSRARGCHPAGMPRYSCQPGEANCVCG